MKKRLYLSLVFLLSLVAVSAHAVPVGPMNYQGRLLDNNGVPVTDSFNFVVRVYDAPTAGTLKYQETLNGVLVEDGVYAFKVGLGPKTGGDSEWDINLWQLNVNDLYLEVVVNGETLTPRHELTSAPHAYTATLALSADALGNKTAAEFDNILEGVCVSGQGKWLDKINKCLGVGATVTNETPDSMMEFPDNNFKNLKLISADLSGSQFVGRNFTDTEFKDSIIHASGFQDTNLTNVVMDNVTFTGPTQAASVLDLTGATFKNMDMSKWNLSSATLNGFSAANLSACPAALPANWVCVKQHYSGSDWVLLGPGVNLSISSAAKVDTFGANTLDLDRDILNGRNLSGANMQGIVFQQDLVNTNLTGANLGYSTFDRIDFSGANLTNTIFANSTIQWLRNLPGAIINGTNFNSAKLYYVDFSEPVSFVSFENATLQNVEFQAIHDASFVRLLCVHCSFNGNLSGKVKFEDAGIYTGGSGDATYFRGTLGDEFIFINVDGSDGVTFENPVPITAVITGGTLKLSGDFSGVAISDATLTHRFVHTGVGNPGPILNNVTLNNINFNMSNGNANFSYAVFQGCFKLGNSLTDFSYGTFTGTNFLNCGSITGANWNGVFVCPDGQPPSAGVNPSSCEDGQLL